MRFTTFALALLVTTASHADLRVVGCTNVLEGAGMIEEAVNASQIADGLTTTGALSREDVRALATSGAERPGRVRRIGRRRARPDLGVATTHVTHRVQPGLHVA